MPERVPAPLSAADTETMARAWQHHQAGDLDAAERLYRDLLRGTPGDPDLRYLLAAVDHARGALDRAIEGYRGAVEAAPDFAEAHAALGAALAARGWMAEAADALRRAVALKPDDAEALANLAVVLRQLGRDAEVAEVADALRRVAEVQPGVARVHHDLGLALAGLGRPDEAAAAYRRALALRPDYPEAHANLGNALLQSGRPDEAAACYRRALELKPDSAEIQYNLGLAYADQGRSDEAIAAFLRAVALKPGSAHSPEAPDAYNDLGAAYADRGRFDEAAAAYRRALALRPDYPEAYNNLGVTYIDQGRLEEAVACYDRALALRPDYPEAHRNRAHAWLTGGDFRRGWDEYEWRWRCPGFHHPTVPGTAWDGAPLRGRTLLVFAEQGLGDTIQFARFAAPARRRGGTVVLACQAPLLALLATCPGVDRVVPYDDPPPPYDLYAPLMSLPRLLGASPDDRPADVPYLAPDPRRLDRWGAVLGPPDGRLRVGVAWQGSPRHPRDRHRSFPPEALAPLARRDDVHLVCLQKGPGADRLAAAAGRPPLTDLGPDLADFADTAAVVRLLDLVICPDTALAHLAGALAVPTWVALPFAPDWRWMLGRDDSPWYPTVRLFRQKAWDDWDGVFARAAEALAAECGARAGGGRQADRMPAAPPTSGDR